MLDVRRLRMLAALDRLGTIAAVADELHLSAPGISMQLGSLEKEVGVPLTERRGRRLALTAAGRLLALHGHDIVNRLSLAEMEVDALRHGAIGSYRLTAFPSAARTFVTDVWRATVEGPLQLSLATHEPEEALIALSTGDADLAILHSYSNVPRDLPSSLTATPLVTEPVWLAAPADDAVLRQPRPDGDIGLEHFAHHRWITPVRPCTCHQMAERACGLAGFTPNVVAETMDFAVQLELVAAGVGVALVPHLAVGTLPAGVVLNPMIRPIHRHLFACRRAASEGDPGLERLVAKLSKAAKTRVPG